MSELPPSEAPHRRIRSFVRREGRMTDGQKAALERLSNRYSLDPIEGVIDFDAAFGRRAPLSFEIGFGAGDALLARAQAHPEWNHVGVEVHRPGVGRALIRAEQMELGNLRVMTRDAVEILRTQIAPGTLHEVVIEFPDPWHKKRHHKRRLVQPAFAQLIAERLTPGGVLRLATDWAEYAVQMRRVLDAQSAFTNLSTRGDGYLDRPATRPLTRFEARGERLGHAVFDLAYRRR
ncbi:MAG: trmB [Panacagrimonas sp.]|jgi:tRNA (guanine-N7-)-methyltransferase|nr:tRNA (guanosine(46)-N7)-methyltransferase TrmB [Panacagrimonas sp.]MCC2659205.1 trmB [Panacagrimonas sp.]